MLLGRNVAIPKFTVRQKRLSTALGSVPTPTVSQNRRTVRAHLARSGPYGYSALTVNLQIGWIDGPDPLEEVFIFLLSFLSLYMSKAMALGRHISESVFALS